ncbi:cytochrome c [Filobacillus milosensis]|uniref:Cytochrome c n=1 Tax=Filobacillus milosensis TaxID=94137 RepID=A0A4Y8IXW1_9BACI|nr:cytochrome c [Filobacillus milosensis]TFB24364.1 cytochrome c [Filobacillus milosensis]
MKKILMGVFSVMLVLAACGGGQDDDGGDTGGDGGTEESGQEETGNGDNGGDGGTDGETAQAGEQLYQQNCSTCHGADLSGGVGPSLKNVGDKYGVEDIVGIIQNGKGQMNAIDISEEDSKSIAEWLVNR